MSKKRKPVMSTPESDQIRQLTFVLRAALDREDFDEVFKCAAALVKLDLKRSFEELARYREKHPEEFEEKP